MLVNYCRYGCRKNVTGKTWKLEMKDHISRPLKMENTNANVSDYNLKNICPLLTVSQRKRNH